MVRLEDNRRVRPFQFYADALGTEFVPEEFDFPEELNNRITEQEYNSIVEDLNEKVYLEYHIESRILCGSFSYIGVGLMITALGLVLVFSSLIAVGIKNRSAGFIFLWTSITCGIITCITGLAVIAFPRKPTKWRERSLAWSEKQSSIYGERGMIFRMEEDDGPSPVIELRPIPSKVFGIKSGQLACSIPTFIPPKNLETVSLP